MQDGMYDYRAQAVTVTAAEIRALSAIGASLPVSNASSLDLFVPLPTQTLKPVYVRGGKAGTRYLLLVAHRASFHGFFPNPFLKDFLGVVRSKTRAAVFPQLAIGVPAIRAQGIPRFGCV